MRFLKLKYIVSYIIIVVVAVLVLLYFVGGLKITGLEKDSLTFDETGFIDFSTGQKEDDGTPINLTYDHNKLIGETATHAMFFDEETTIATIVDKQSCTTPGDYSTATVTYQTAKDDTTSAAGANLLLYYAARSNGAAQTTPYDTMLSSVKFRNTLTGESESHYKLKYIDGGVQILYDIGRFSANDDYFPVKFNIANYNAKYTSETELSEAELEAIEVYNRSTLDERFRGNVLFGTKIKNPAAVPQVLEFNGMGYVYSYDAVQYIEENNLALVATDLEEGFDLGYWMITDIDPSFYNSYGTHLNSSTSPCTNNPFFSSQMFNSLSGSYYKVIHSKEDPSLSYYDTNMKSSMEKQACYGFLYTSFEQTDYSENRVPIVWESGEPIIRGGYHRRDAEGNFLYDDDGKPVQQLYSLEQVAEDNALFDVVTSTSLERFQVCLQLKLTDNGLEATVLSESLRDSDHKALNPIYDHDYIMTSVQFLKEMTTASERIGPKEDDPFREGMMIIPDGSGAIINFSNGKAELNYAGYSKSVYGLDKAFMLNRAVEDVENLMLGMYGFIDTTDQKGIMTVVEQGASQSKLVADVPRGSNRVNTIFYTTNVRENEYVTAGTGWNAVQFPKWTKVLAPNDITYRFIFLENTELSYTGVAQKYREYLIDKYNLTPKDNTTTNVTNLNFLGAFERYQMLLGIKYMKPDNLTTFSQAKTVVSELLGLGVNNLTVSYSSWTDDEFEYEATAHLRASEALGRKKGLVNLAQYLEDNNINFYPELYVASSKGYDYPFGNMKYTSRSVGNNDAMQYPFNLATLYIDKQLTPTYYVSPKYYQSLAQRLYASFDDFGITGAYLPDLGNMRIGDYKKKSEIFNHDSVRYQIATLEYLQSQLESVQLSAPYDFAFPYVDVAIDVPVSSSTYGIFDQTIPFYQLVVSGLFDYTTELVNGTSDRSTNYYFVKALETGANVSFQLSYENPNVLLETDYTQYFKTYYENWKDTIVSFNTRINDANIHGGQLVNHERIAKDISKVTYSNGVVLVINGSNRTYTYGLTTISPYNYIKIGG